MPPLVEFRGVEYSIGGRQILSGIDLSVEAGETLVLLGRSGSGKTTLLKMVNGLLIPDRGEIRFENRPVAEWDPIRLRRRIGYVIQEAGLFPHHTVERNIGLVPRLENWPDDRVRRRTEELLGAMGLPPEYRSRYPARLSGGEKQRVGIARALAAKPPLLLLDEPFGALDPVTRLELQRQFRRLRDELRQTALFVTHDVREALLLGSRIALLNQGRLELVATGGEFLRARSPEAQAFLAGLDEEWRQHV